MLLLFSVCLLLEGGGMSSSSEPPPPLASSSYMTNHYHHLQLEEALEQCPGGEDHVVKCGSVAVNEARDAAANNRTCGVRSTVRLDAALGIFLGTGAFAALIATIFQAVRHYVYHDASNLDTAFDAGGKVSIGLTATTIVSQWTWTGTLLQSSTVASKFGISGPYWYAAGASIQIIIFAILSIMLKTKAPGAKTFLQVMKARYGKTTHIVFCMFAFFTNLIVTLSLLLGGVAVLTSLVDGLSPELACMILALVIGCYTLIGGLGATFYVSYFNTTLIFILILILVAEVFYNPYKNPDNPFGSSAALYDFLNCTRAPEERGNRQHSYATFYSQGGLMFGIVNIVGNFGAVFCDQAYWQSSVAAKPVQGVWGFISGGLTWFAIPFTLATTMGLAYLGLSSAQGGPLLTDTDIARGLSAPVVAQQLLGITGEFLMLLLVLMAVMSTGSAEVIAVASILVYDIYQSYIFPFRRPPTKPGCCILCEKPLRELGNKRERDGTICGCPSIVKCEGCKLDSITRHTTTHTAMKPANKCGVHGEYLTYQSQLSSYKNWCLVVITLLTIPLTLFGWAVDLNLSWTYLFTGVLISSAVVPIALSITWARPTGKCLVVATVGGTVVAIVAWLGSASRYEGGLAADSFVKNTGELVPMLVGNVVAICVGAVVSIVLTLWTTRSLTKEEAAGVWELTRDIDNPLHPWVEVYKEDLDLSVGDSYHDRPSMSVMMEKFRPAKLTAYIAAGLVALLFIIIWPASMLATEVLDVTSLGSGRGSAGPGPSWRRGSSSWCRWSRRCWPSGTRWGRTRGGGRAARAGRRRTTRALSRTGSG
jgi:Na+/proline symporter